MRVLILLLSSSWPAQSQQNSLKINIIGFENSQGKAFVEIVNQQDKPLKQLVLPIRNNEVNFQYTFVADVPIGIRVYHDKNNNQQLDKNVLGMPTERWGSSAKVRPSFRGPTLSELLFTPSNKVSLLIQIK